VKNASDAIIGAAQATYLEAIEPARDALLAEMEQYAKDRRQPISDPEVASLLAITARACGAKRIVEVGTNIGYGAIVLARAAGPDARVVTLELNAETVKIARGYVARAGLEDRVEVREGDAIASLEQIAGEPDEIDLVYIDCVKEDYSRYLELVAPKLSPRGVILADNVLWRGLVAATDVPASEKVRVEALRAFNRALVSHPLLRAVVLPLGAGGGYAVRRAS
jgi:predicted O-methyltransferase YrrM